MTATTLVRRAVFAVIGFGGLLGTAVAQPSDGAAGDKLVEAIILVESQGNTYRVGKAGERGLMQIRLADTRLCRLATGLKCSSIRTNSADSFRPSMALTRVSPLEPNNRRDRP
jgi:hypothetical protein